MKVFVLLLLIGGGCLSASAQQPSVTAVPSGISGVVPRITSAPYNDLILQQIHTMPLAGGYSANHQATERLSSALFFDGLSNLNVDATRAKPSYCSGATYLVFMKTVGALVRTGALNLGRAFVRRVAHQRAAGR